MALRVSVGDCVSPPFIQVRVRKQTRLLKNVRLLVALLNCQVVHHVLLVLREGLRLVQLVKPRLLTHHHCVERGRLEHQASQVVDFLLDEARIVAVKLGLARRVAESEVLKLWCQLIDDQVKTLLRERLVRVNKDARVNAMTVRKDANLIQFAISRNRRSRHHLQLVFSVQIKVVKSEVFPAQVPCFEFRRLAIQALLDHFTRYNLGSPHAAIEIRVVLAHACRIQVTHGLLVTILRHRPFLLAERRPSVEAFPSRRKVWRFHEIPLLVCLIDLIHVQFQGLSHFLLLLLAVKRVALLVADVQLLGIEGY